MTEKHICIDDEVVDSITFKDGEIVLGTLRSDGSQQCSNGYKFDVKFKQTIEKEE